MTTLRIPFASKRQRDNALNLLVDINFEALDKSEPAGAGARFQAGEILPGLRDGRRQIVLQGDHLPQWAHAMAAAIAWRLGKRHEQTQWASLFLNEDLLLVACTSEDVRGTRGLLEVDEGGRLLTWRDGGRRKAGPRMPAQIKAIERLISKICDEGSEAKKKRSSKKST